jgi:hypothetical protein
MSDTIKVLDAETIRFTAGPARLTMELGDAMANVTSPSDSQEYRQMVRVELMLWALNAQILRFTENIMAGQAAQLNRTKDLTPEGVLKMLAKEMPNLMKIIENGQAPDLTGMSVSPSNGSDTERLEG